MPKVKTNSSAKKRFKISGTGKIKRRKAYHSHILTKKAKVRKTRLTQEALVHKSDEKRVKDLLNI